MAVGHHLVDSPEALDTAMARIRTAERLAIDTEADSRHHYPEKVCLIQVAADDVVFIVDPLARIDVTAIGPVLADPGVEKIFHGADFDLRGLDRDWGFAVRRLYDTNVAARFAGLERFGLAALIEDLLGRAIPKLQRLQRADWSKRPIDPEALDYAASDVEHLVAVRDALDERLGALGRRAWVAEEFERMEEIRYLPPDPETAFLSVRGSSRLDSGALGVLRALFEFREGEARRADRPTAFIIPPEAMVYLAAHPDADLTEVPGLAQSIVRRLGPGIRQALRKGVEAGPYRRPAPPRPFRQRPSPTQTARLARLKEWRAGEGTRLNMDPPLLWPTRSLERLAREPGSLDEELASPDVRWWQRDLFEGALREALR